MFFLLRCALCLGVVYAAIIAAHGPSAWQSTRADTERVARSGAQSLAETASAGATAFCAHHADDCLADAGRLSALFRATEPEPTVADLAAASEAEVPLPVADPRRGHRDAKLTRAY